MHHARQLALAVVALILVFSQSQAADTPATSTWPQWRGVNRDGISLEKNLLAAWPDGGPTLLWKASGLGNGYSSVAVVNGRIYTLGKQGPTTSLVALNEENGAVEWSTPFGSGDKPNCTPTVDGELVYAVSRNGDLICANALSGEQIWKKNFGKDFGGKMMSGWGYSESPLVDGNRLICTPGSPNAMLAALNKRNGRTIWTTKMPKEMGPAGADGAAYSSIVISNAAGIRQYVQLIGRGVIGVNARNGRLQWKYNRVANGTANVPTPIVHGDYVFSSTGYGDGGSALLKLKKQRGGVAVEEVYYRESRKLQNHHGGMILVGDHIYMGHGNNNGLPVCFEMSTGEVAWRPGRGPGSGSVAVAFADGHLYFRYENGLMALIEATPERFELKSTFKLATNNGESWPHPAIANGRLYLRDQNDLLCYDIRR